MSNYITPLLFVIISLGIFSTYVYPGVQAIQVLQEQEALVDEALYKAKTLTEKRDELIAIESEFASEDMARLGVLLPVRLDTIRHIVEIDDMARRNNITIQSFGLPGTKNSGTGTGAAQTSGDVAGQPNSAILKLSCTGTYENFRTFVSEIETSLSLYDIVTLAVDQASLSPEEIKELAQRAAASEQRTGTRTGPSVELSYMLDLQTYWLEPTDIPS